MMRLTSVQIKAIFMAVVLFGTSNILYFKANPSKSKPTATNFEVRGTLEAPVGLWGGSGGVSTPHPAKYAQRPAWKPPQEESTPVPPVLPTQEPAVTPAPTPYPTLAPTSVPTTAPTQRAMWVFMDIPKTGGSTLTEIIYHTHKNNNRKVSTFAAQSNNVQNPDQLTATSYEEWKSWDVLYSHDDYSITSIIPVPYYSAVMLREPIYHIRSAFDASLEDAKSSYNDSFSSFVANEMRFSPESTNTLANYQVQWMAGVSPGGWPGSWYSEEQQKNIAQGDILVEAKKNLEKTAFVGLADYFKESMCIYWHRFRFAPSDTFEVLLPSTTTYPALDDATAASLNKVIAKEIEFYGYAKQVFLKQYNEMRKSLWEKNILDWPAYCYQEKLF